MIEDIALSIESVRWLYIAWGGAVVIAIISGKLMFLMIKKGKKIQKNILSIIFIVSLIVTLISLAMFFMIVLGWMALKTLF